MSSAVSQEYKFEMDNEALVSRSYRTILPSESDSYNLGSRCLISIPQTHQGFLNTSNSWLNLTMTISGLTGTNVTTNTTDVCLSSIGAYACIQELNVISGSGYVSQMRNHQQIMSFLIANNSNFDAQNPNSISCGMPPYDADNDQQSPALAVATSAIAEQKYSLPLAGIMSSAKHLPLGMMSGAGQALTLEIIFTNDVRNIIYSNKTSSTTQITGGTVSFTAEYDACMISVNDNAYREILDASRGGNGIVSWSDSQIHAVNHTVTVSELNSASKSYKQTIIEGVRPRQLLAVYVGGFGASLGCGDPWSIGNYWSADWRLRVGSSHYPARYITGSGEAKSQVGQCFSQNALTLYNTIGDDSNASMSYRQLADTTATFTQAEKGGSGFSFVKFWDTGEGIDQTGKQMVLECSLETSGVTAVNAINSSVMKKFGVVYSIELETGQFSVSY